MLEIKVNGELQKFDGILRCNEDGYLLLELEPHHIFSDSPREDPYRLTKDIILQLQQTTEEQSLYQKIVNEIARLTGFDRVMLYRFDEEYHGDVIAEFIRKDTFDTSYLGLHFPNSDIPQNARDLYMKNWLRIIPNRDFAPVEVIATSNRRADSPLDISLSVLRSVSPYHIEYLKIIDVCATMSASVFEGDRLWGLISCHRQETCYVPYSVRMAVEFLTQSFSLLLSQRQTTLQEKKVSKLNEMSRQMAAEVAGGQTLTEALYHQRNDVLAIMRAQGFALLDNHEFFVGVTPAREQIYELRRWIDKKLSESGKQIFSTHHLEKDYDDLPKVENMGSGLLAIAMEHPYPGHMIWFREEEGKTVNWAGKPTKEIVYDNKGVRYSPRRSFEIWQEEQHGRSIQWNEIDRRVAREFRTRIYEIQSITFKRMERENNILEKRVRERTQELEVANELLQKAIEKKDVSEQELANNLSSIKAANVALERFAYVTSHDLREPLRVVSNFSQLLKKKYLGQLGGKGEQYIQFIQEGTVQMQRLIDDLLKYSRAQNVKNTEREVSMGNVLRETLRFLSLNLESSQGKVTKETALPSVWADRMMMIQLLQNIIGNAIKYRHSERPLQISIGTTEENDHFYRFWVRDNGIGIEKNNTEIIFSIFQRLHLAEDYEGTGIGLAICKVVVENLGGKIYVESTPGEGSSFYFTLPKPTHNA